MTDNLGFGIVGAEALEKFYHCLLLGGGAGVGRIAVDVETALVANADAAEASCLMAGFQGFYREIPVYPCGGTMDYYQIDFSHNEFFFIIFLLLYKFSKITPSLFTIKEGSTSLPKPLSSQKRGDVAGDAIALPEFLYRQRSLCPQGAADDCLTQQSCDCLCGVNRLAGKVAGEAADGSLASENGGIAADELVALQRELKHLGLFKFAGAVMYVLHEVLGLSDDKMIVPMDEKRGRLLLSEILNGGNFGKHFSKY